MEKEILILTADNVFFLLLKSHIESLNNNVLCLKISNHTAFNKQNGNNASLILIDGKMIDISAIELIYNIRNEKKLLTKIWLFNEVNISTYKSKAFEVGANRIIEKPFDPIEIAREIVLTIL